MVSVSKEVTKASSASKLNAHGQTSHGTASEWPRRYIRGSPPFGALLLVFYSLSSSFAFGCERAASDFRLRVVTFCNVNGQYQ